MGIHMQFLLGTSSLADPAQKLCADTVFTLGFLEDAIFTVRLLRQRLFYYEVVREH